MDKEDSYGRRNIYQPKDLDPEVAEWVQELADSEEVSFSKVVFDCLKERYYKLKEQRE